jgi:hypothetical protein
MEEFNGSSGGTKIVLYLNTRGRERKKRTFPFCPSHSLTVSGTHLNIIVAGDWESGLCFRA